MTMVVSKDLLLECLLRSENEIVQKDLKRVNLYNIEGFKKSINDKLEQIRTLRKQLMESEDESFVLTGIVPA